MSKDPIVVAGATRTPMGGFLGSLSPLTAPQLGAETIRSILSQTTIKPESVDETIMGNVLPAGVGQGQRAPGRKKGRTSDGCGATTINKLCGSGMKAVMFGHDLLRAGSAGIVMAGGMESMSNAPYVLQGARKGYRMGPGNRPRTTCSSMGSRTRKPTGSWGPLPRKPRTGRATPDRPWTISPSAPSNAPGKPLSRDGWRRR